MRSFDYGKLADKAWDNDILNLVAKTHEYKGRQDSYAGNQSRRNWTAWLKLQKYRVQKALIK